MEAQTGPSPGRAIRPELSAIDRRLRGRLGRAVYLLLLLAEGAGADGLVQGGASVRAEELAKALGVGTRQARRDLQRLRHLGLVDLVNTGRGFTIRFPGPSPSQ